MPEAFLEIIPKIIEAFAALNLAQCIVVGVIVVIVFLVGLKLGLWKKN
jgi:flagellar biosynthesis/type III secretory pathway M-ring protein FliF/YscJ